MPAVNVVALLVNPPLKLTVAVVALHTAPGFNVTKPVKRLPADTPKLSEPATVVAPVTRIRAAAAVKLMTPAIVAVVVNVILKAELSMPLAFTVSEAAAAFAVVVMVCPVNIVTESPATGPAAPHPAAHVAATFQLPVAAEVHTNAKV